MTSRCARGRTGSALNANCNTEARLWRIRDSLATHIDDIAIALPHAEEVSTLAAHQALRPLGEHPSSAARRGCIRRHATSAARF
jgi:hypothetical protein